MNNLRKLEIKSHIKEGDSRYKLVNNNNAKSWVWQNFQLILFDGKLQEYACCTKCKDVLAYSSKRGTGSLIRHICGDSKLDPSRPKRIRKKSDPLAHRNVTSNLNTKFNNWTSNHNDPNTILETKIPKPENNYYENYDDNNSEFTHTNIDVKGYFESREPEISIGDYGSVNNGEQAQHAVRHDGQHSNKTTQDVHSNASLDVFELLMQSPVGQRALEYYNACNKLDLEQRLSVLNILKVALNDTEWHKYMFMLQRLTMQLRQLFPNADYHATELFKSFTQNEISMHAMEDVPIYNLLNSWGLPHLYQIFREQRVTMEVLNLMEPQHIQKLFKNIPVGDEVIFMYNFKHWHAEHNMPLICDKQNFLNLATILKDSNGAKLRTYYNNHGSFTDSQRALLIYIVYNYISTSGQNLRQTEYDRLLQDIKEMFPTEKTEHYKHNAQNRIYRKVSTQKLDINTLAYDQKIELQALCILRTESLAIEQFEIYWKRCLHLRFDDLSHLAYGTILQNWPEYMSAECKRLISIDFECMYPNAAHLLQIWPEKSGIIKQAMKNKIPNLKYIQQENPDSRDLTLLWLSHYFLSGLETNVEHITTYNTKLLIQNNISESQNAFVILEKSFNDILTKLSALEAQNSNLPPCLLIVGNLNNIEAVYVYFEKQNIPMRYFISAADVLFKIFLLFKIDFPEDAKQFYSFVSAFFYNIQPKDMQPNVTELINELNSRLN